MTCRPHWGIAIKSGMELKEVWEGEVPDIERREGGAQKTVMFLRFNLGPCREPLQFATSLDWKVAIRPILFYVPLNCRYMHAN